MPLDNRPPRFTADGFQNLAAGLGMGSRNLQSQGTYQFAYYTRYRALLEAMYRSSWVINKAVNIPADDMTRAGIKIDWPGDSDAPRLIMRAFKRLRIWRKINTCMRWARLYGGCIGVLMIDGQRLDKPLKIETIGRDQFKGIYPIDRWLLQPQAQALVDELGPHFGKPEFYQVASGSGVPFDGQTIHYSRVLRFEGLELPYYQRQAEWGWGLSIVEPIYERMVAYDTATHGTANLIHRAHLRTYKVRDLRQIAMTMDQDSYNGFLKFFEFLRAAQMSEGLTMIDSEDEIEHYNYGFTGLPDVLVEFGQQLCAAIDVPATRFFGTAPKGMNATGESDLRNYYDKIAQDQGDDLLDPIYTVCHIVSQSVLGMPMEDDVDIEFNPLWQLSDTERSNIANTDTTMVMNAFNDRLISEQTALRELRASSRITGRWSSITEQMINDADDEVVPMPEAGDLEGEAGQGGQAVKGKPAKLDTSTEQPK